jgi:hypothetical protein
VTIRYVVTLIVMKGLMSLRRSVLKWFAEKATGNKWFEHGALLVRQLPTDDWIVQPALIGGILEEERCRRFKTLAGAVAYAEREYHGPAGARRAVRCAKPAGAGNEGSPLGPRHAKPRANALPRYTARTAR